MLLADQSHFLVSSGSPGLASANGKHRFHCPVTRSVLVASEQTKPVTFDTVATAARHCGLLLRNRSIGPLLRIEAYVESTATRAAWLETTNEDRRGNADSKEKRFEANEALSGTKPWPPRTPTGYVSGICLAPLLRRTHVERIELFVKRSTSTPRGTAKYLALAAACEALRRRSPHCYFLAIDDGLYRHLKLVHYFERLGFQSVRRISSGILERLLWGGCGTLMYGNLEVLARNWWADLRPPMNS